MTFLERVTSRAGKNVIAGMKPKVDEFGNPVYTKKGEPDYYWIHKWGSFADHRWVEATLNYMAGECGDVYFGLGAFQKDQSPNANGYNRKASNCVALRSLWLDIDCGETKFLKHNGVGVYRTQQDGLRALVAWIQQVGFPKPTIINSSGEGLHVYWVLDRDVPKDEFREYGAIFKGLVRRFGLMADPTRTGEVSSVLRPVGTIHVKSGKVVTTIKDNVTPVNWDHIKAILNAGKIHLQDAAYQAELNRAKGLDWTLGQTPAWLKGDEPVDMGVENIPKRFGTIITKQELEGKGCAQLYRMYKDQEHVPEPMWAGGLSIIKFCEDKDEWAVKFSEDYSGYDKDETFRKMEQFQGPRTCSWFNANNPGVCDGCPHFKNLVTKPNQSPLMLGIQDDRVPIVVQAPLAVQTTAGVEASVETETFVIPAYPFPFKRNPNGGGILKESGEEGIGPSQVFPYDFYLFERTGEGLDGIPRIWARFHSPNDGVMEMELTPDEIFASGQVLLQKLANHHIYLNTVSQAGEMGHYLRTQLVDLQAAKAMSHAPKQLGWTATGNFVIGRTEYTQAGPRLTPANDTVIAQKFAKACERVKDYDQKVQLWRDVVSSLYGAPDAAMYRLVLASGFGAVIRSRYALERGGIINLFSEESGVGKTTLTKVVASIYGDPEPFVVQAKHGTTNIAFFEMLSYLNSIPMVIDETGQMNAYDLMEFIHTCTSGKAKLRGSANSNDIRASLPGWRTFVYSSSNVSIWNRVSEARLENEAYIMRVLELPFKSLKQSNDKTFGDDLMRRLDQVKGVCAPILFDYIVKNDTSLRKEWDDTNLYLSRKAQMHSRYRFWVDMMTAAAVGASVGYRLGLFPFDPQTVKDNCVKILSYLATKAQEKVMSDMDIMSDFFTSNIAQTLVVRNPDQLMPQQMPHNKVGVRIEVFDNLVHISQQAVNEFTKERGFDRGRFEQILADCGGKRFSVNMLANTQMDMLKTRTPCWTLDMNHPKVKEKLQIPLEDVNANQTVAGGGV